MTHNKLRVLPIGMSILMVLQPLTSALAQETARAKEMDAGRAQFLEAHKRAESEAHARRSLAPEPVR